MAGKPRLPKTTERRLAECETHLYFLSDARQRYSHEEQRFKQIAAELRVLVGDHRPERRLLLAMMAQYGFSYDVQPPGPPFDKQAIPTVGWRDDPEHQRLAGDLRAALGDDAKLAAVLDRQAAMRRAMSFEEYVDRGLAVYIAPYDYSFRALVLAVSQQLGSSHEDEAVDVPLLRMEQMRVGGHLGYVAPLLTFTDLVLHVGGLFVAHLVKTQAYKPKHFVVSTV